MKGQLVHIVDDDEAIRKALSLAFAAHNIPVVTYPSAEAFLEEASWVLPGCLILDLRMPGMGGERLLARLAEEGDPPPTIVLTAHGSVDSAVRTIKAGAVEFLQKPCPTRVLLERVRDAIELDSARLQRIQRRGHLEQKLSALTPRERDVLEGVMSGKTSAQIAESLGLQSKSIEIYRSQVLTKMEFSSSFEMVRALLLAYPGRWDREATSNNS